MLQRELSNINITVNVNTKLSSSFRFTLQLRFRIIQFPISYATCAQCYVAPIRIGSRCSIMADKNSYIFYYAKTLISYRTSENTYFLHFVVHSYINNLKTVLPIVLYSARIYTLPVTKSYLTIRGTYGYIKTTILTDFQSPVRELYFTVPAIRYYENITLLSCSFQDFRTGQSYGKRIPITVISRTTTVFYDPQGNAKFSPVSHLAIYMSPRNIFRFILFSRYVKNLDKNMIHRGPRPAITLHLVEDILVDDTYSLCPLRCVKEIQKHDHSQVLETFA